MNPPQGAWAPLAELADRLRRFASTPCPPPPTEVDRLAVAGRLVRHMGTESGVAGLVQVGEAAVALAAAARAAVPALTDGILRVIVDAADHLEGILTAVDAGRPPNHPANRLDDPELPRRWTIDEPGPGGAESPAAGSGPVVLLVGSRFRRTAVQDKLLAHGQPCVVADDPEAALALVAGNPAPRAVVCDDQEPRRHLSRLRALLASRGLQRPPLVLLVAAAGDAANLAHRAARRGADASWSEPFDPRALPWLGDS